MVLLINTLIIMRNVGLGWTSTFSTTTTTYLIIIAGELLGKSACLSVTVSLSSCSLLFATSPRSAGLRSLYYPDNPSSQKPNTRFGGGVCVGVIINK